MQNLKNKAYKWLRWSEKYTKTDMVYLAKGGFWLTLGQIAGGFFGFILSIIFANFLAPEVYGVYKYILSIGSVLTIATLLGYNPAVTQAVARNIHISYEHIIKKRFQWGLISIFASLAIAGYYLFNENLILAKGVLLAGILASFSEIFFSYDGFLLGRKDFRKSSIYNLFARFFTSIVVAIVVLLNQNIYIIVCSYFFPTLLIRIFAGKTISSNKISKNIIETKKVEEYGKHLSAVGIIGVIGANIDKILIFQFLGGTPLAVYYFVMILPDYIKNIFKNVGVLALPKFANQTTQITQSLLSKRIQSMFFFILPITLVYILLTPIVFKIFFPVYYPYVWLSQIYAIVILLTPKIFYRTFFEAHKKSSELYIFQAISVATRIILFFVFLPILGLLGAIIANILSEVVTYATLYLLNKRVERGRHFLASR